MDRHVRERLNRSSRSMHSQSPGAPLNRGRASAAQSAKNVRRTRRTRSKFQTILRTIGILLLLVLAAGAAFYISLQVRMTVSPVPTSLTDTATPLPTEPFNLAIFGLDTRNPDAAARADTIILARIDPIENQMWMVSIPRDTRVELPGYGTQKINAAYVFGGSDMAIQAVKDVTGQEVNHFITLNFLGFVDIVDAMDGIEIDVPFAIYDPKGDITPDGSASHIDSGLQNLDGVHALTFVRHRDGFVDGDFGRMRAQQDFFRAIGSQLTDVPVWRLPLVANSFADNTTTNFTPFGLAMMARAMRGVDADNMYLTTLPGTWHSPYVIIDEAAAAEVWHNFGATSFEQ